jgi:hypothetical protein
MRRPRELHQSRRRRLTRAFEAHGEQRACCWALEPPSPSGRSIASQGGAVSNALVPGSPATPMIASLAARTCREAATGMAAMVDWADYR